MKYCCYCKKYKEESEFIKKKNGTLMSRCTICYHKEKECKVKRTEVEKKQLRPASVKQQKVLKYTKKDRNIIVKAVAGAGKTTTILHVGNDNKQKQIGVITYSARLKTETKDRLKEFNINNIDIFSYHSLCKRFYDNSDGLLTDDDINRILKENSFKIDIKSYDMLIIDECQDMTPLYYMIIKKFIKDNYEYDISTETNIHKLPQMIILGDERQSIFKHNGSDHRYLNKLLVKQLFKNDLIWKELQLDESFRVPRTVAEFINNCLFDEEIITSNKLSITEKPRYIIAQPYSDYCNDIVDEVRYYLDLGYKNEDIFILAPSIKKGKQSPVASLSRKLSHYFKNGDKRFKQFMPNDDESQLTEDVLKGKLVISTFHQVKGLERKVVIIYNFDNTYFKYYKKDISPYECPNEIYVAVTRSLERVSLIHDYESEYFSFINKDNIEKYCDVIKKKKLSIKNKGNNLENYSVSELIKHVPYNITSKIHNVLYDITKIDRVEKGKINIKGIVKQGDGHESVSDITGTAIPLYYAIRYLQKSGLNDFDIPLNSHDYNQRILELANLKMCKMDCIDYKLVQIIKYNWLSKQNLKECCDRLISLNLLSENGTFEKLVKNIPNEETFYKEISGVMDYKDFKSVVEFKCVEELDSSHFIQLAIYKYLNELHNKVYKYYLYNILSDELYELKSNHLNLKNMMKILIINRCFPIKPQDETEFMKKCMEYNYNNLYHN